MITFFQVPNVWSNSNGYYFSRNPIVYKARRQESATALLQNSGGFVSMRFTGNVTSSFSANDVLHLFDVVAGGGAVEFDATVTSAIYDGSTYTNVLTNVAWVSDYAVTSYYFNKTKQITNLKWRTILDDASGTPLSTNYFINTHDANGFFTVDISGVCDSFLTGAIRSPLSYGNTQVYNTTTKFGETVAVVKLNHVEVINNVDQTPTSTTATGVIKGKNEIPNANGGSAYKKLIAPAPSAYWQQGHDFSFNNTGWSPSGIGGSWTYPNNDRVYGICVSSPLGVSNYYRKIFDAPTPSGMKVWKVKIWFKTSANFWGFFDLRTGTDSFSVTIHTTGWLNLAQEKYHYVEKYFTSNVSLQGFSLYSEVNTGDVSVYRISMYEENQASPEYFEPLSLPKRIYDSSIVYSYYSFINQAPSAVPFVEEVFIDGTRGYPMVRQAVVNQMVYDAKVRPASAYDIIQAKHKDAVFHFVGAETVHVPIIDISCYKNPVQLISRNEQGGLIDWLFDGSIDLGFRIVNNKKVRVMKLIAENITADEWEYLAQFIQGGTVYKRNLLDFTSETFESDVRDGVTAFIYNGWKDISDERRTGVIITPKEVFRPIWKDRFSFAIDIELASI
jgi:hypothetical protein